MSMFNDIIKGYKDNETECIAYSTLVFIFAKRCPAGRWAFLGPGSETKLYSTDKERPGGEWDRVAELMMIKFGGKRTPSFPSHESVVSRNARKQRRWKISYTDTIETVFRTIISVNQLSIYGAVSDLCEEYSRCQTGRPVVAEQSDPHFAPASLLMTTPTPSIEIPAQENPLQKHKERVENFSQPDQLIKVCIDAGFLKTVEVGQYFMTKHTDEFLQIAAPVTCREYTLPRDDKSTDPKGWIQGNTKIGPVLEVKTSYQQGKHGVEIRIESVSNDKSHSWVRISHGLNKLVTDFIDKEYDDNEQETSTTKAEVFAFACRSKAKAKPRRPSTTCSSSRTTPFLERTWIDIEPGAQFDEAYPVAKKNKHCSSTRRITSRRR